jgi:trehalose 6-phosphate phosphatase
MPNYLFDHSLEIITTLKHVDDILLLLDYDGTLVSFKDRPNQVYTPENVKKVLMDLIKEPGFEVVIITGRRLEDIRSLVALQGLSFAALHGLHIEFSNGKMFTWDQSKNTQPLLKKIKKKVYAEFEEEKKIYVEDKKYTLAFHYRGLPEHKTEDAIERVMELIRRTDLEGSLDVIMGAKVIEVRPRGWDKGKATELLWKEIEDHKRMFPIYVGDDTTDEDAFRYLKNQGLTVWVSNKSDRDTTARYWVNDPSETFEFLKLLRAIKKGGD